MKEKRYKHEFRLQSSMGLDRKGWESWEVRKGKQSS